MRAPTSGLAYGEFIKLFVNDLDELSPAPENEVKASA